MRPSGGLGDADLLRQPRALVDERVDLLVDGVDAVAHRLQIELQWPCRRAVPRPLPAAGGLLLAASHAVALQLRQIIRAASTPSMARILLEHDPRRTAPSVSISV